MGYIKFPTQAKYKCHTLKKSIKYVGGGTLVRAVWELAVGCEEWHSACFDLYFIKKAIPLG